MGLLCLAEGDPNLCVQGSVRSICGHLGLCDKTLRKAVEELQANSLLFLSDTKTNLGANSFKYFPTFPPNFPFNKKELTDQLCSDVLFSQRPNGGKKITVNQRVLMVAGLSIIDRFGLITALHTVYISKLTGVPCRNILPNLLKLEAKGFLTPITGLGFGQKTKKPIWAYQFKLSKNSSEVRLEFDRFGYSEVEIVSLLIRLEELKKELRKLDELKTQLCPRERNDLIKKEGSDFDIGLADIEYYLCSPFSSVPDDICHSLLEAIDAGQLVWRRLERDGLVVYLDLLLQITAAQIINNRSSVLASDMYRECNVTSSMVLHQLNCFPITSNQREVLAQIMVLLSKMVATAIMNQIARGIPELKLNGCDLYIESLKPHLVFHCCGSQKVSEVSTYILKYEPKYKEKNDDHASR
jgi:hypothetical protein